MVKGHGAAAAETELTQVSATSVACTNSFALIPPPGKNSKQQQAKEYEEQANASRCGGGFCDRYPGTGA